MREFFFLLCFVSYNLVAWAAANDDCGDALEIKIGDGGWGRGTFSSEQVSLKKASAGLNEPFHELMDITGLNQKSVWYYFDLPTTRSVEIRLKQKELNIENNHVGFAVHKMDDCSPNAGTFSYSFPAIAQMGYTRSTCLEKGRYYVQVCARGNVMDSIYLQLNIKRPLGRYGHLQDAMSITNKNDLSFYDDCIGTDSLAETISSFGTKSSHVFYSYLRTPNYFDQVFLNIDHIGEVVHELYEVQDSVNQKHRLIDSAFFGSREAGYLQYLCGELQPNTLYMLKSYTDYSMQIENAWVLGKRPSEASQYSKLKKPFDLGTVSAQVYELEEYISCEAKANEEVCKTLVDSIRTSFRTKHDSTNVDGVTTSGFWVKFTLNEKLRLKATIRSAEEHYSVAPNRLFVLRDNLSGAPCREIIDDSYDGYCLEPGGYAIYVATPMRSEIDRQLVQNTTLGMGFKLTLNFEEPPFFRTSVFYNHHRPANIASILNQWGYANRKTPPDWLYGSEQQLLINNDSLKGYFSFTIFHLDQAVYLDVFPTGYPTVNNLIFKGNAQLGLDQLEVTDSIGNNSFRLSSGGWWSGGNKSFQSDGKLDSGWYTIVSYGDNLNECSGTEYIARHRIVAKPERVDENCRDKYHRPHLARTVNGNNPIKVFPAAGEPERSTDATQFVLSACSGAYKKEVESPKIYKPGKYKSNFRYLEYSVFRTSNVQGLVVSGDDFQVLKGDIRIDSSIVEHAANVVGIGSRSNNLEVCRLEPGVYTVIAGSRWSTPSVKLFFYHFFNAEYNWAKTALDLGTVSKSVTTDNLVLSCDNNKHQIHYQENEAERNQWITFRLNKPGNYSFNAVRNVNAAVMKASRGQNISFSEVKKQGLTDSTKGRLIPMKVNYYYKTEHNYERFYVLITADDRLRNVDYTFQIKFTEDTLGTEKGDYCANAIEWAVNDTLPKTLSGWNSLHTIGEGYGEQDSIQGLLNLPRNAVKTTWFKLNIDQWEGYDLSFNQERSFSGWGIKLYYGSCEALTPLGFLRDRYSEAGISCVGKGAYYMQAYDHHLAQRYADVSFALQNKSEPCRPINTQSVLANFSALGGCNNEPIEFTNKSTQGKNMAFEWDFGDGSTSNLANPTHQYSSGADTFSVKLIALNIATGQTDTVVKRVLSLSKFPYYRPLRDTFILCSLKVKPQVKSNDVHFSWSRTQGRVGMYYSFTDTPVIIPSADTSVIKLERKLANCTLIDSFKIIHSRYPLRLNENQGVLCGADSIKIGLEKGYDEMEYLWSTGAKTASIYVLDSGGFYLVQSQDSSCADTIAFRTYKPDKPYITTHSEPCANDSFYMNSHFWLPVDGRDTSRYIHLKNRQEIPLRFIPQNEHLDSACYVLDTIRFDRIRSLGQQIPDTTLCPKKSVYLNPQLGGASFFWNTGETSPYLEVDEPGTYIVKIQVDECYRFDTSEVKWVEPLSLGIDTNICDTMIPFLLDAGPASSYVWSNGSSGRIATVTKPESVSLQVIRRGCTLRDTLMIHTDCPPTLFIPNAFSPGSDLINPVFLAKGRKIEEFSMRIYARNGQMVFISTSLNKGWDGSQLGEWSPMGQYYYIVEYRTGSQWEHRSGLLTLIR